jgi:hypothetical protein
VSVGGSVLRRRLLGVAIGVVLGIVAGVLVNHLRGPVAGAARVTRVLRPTDDTSVDASSPDGHDGRDKRLAVDGTPARIVYLRFDVADLGSPITSATLRLQVQADDNAASPSAGSVAPVADTDWSEDTLTWADRPATGAAVFAGGRAHPGRWVDFDVSTLVRGAGPVAFAIESHHADGAFFWASEAGRDRAPQLVVSTGDPAEGPTIAGGPWPAPVPQDAVRVLAAGDIAGCDWDGDELTAQILDRYPADTPILALGDTVQVEGTEDEFTRCFAPNWGRHLAQIRPTVGNHEYLTDDAGPYWTYFGAATGTAEQGYYSYDVGAWHVVVLNAECWKSDEVGCDPGTPQLDWLTADLAAHPNRCTLAYFHVPLFSSIEGEPRMRPTWEVLDTGGVDLVLNGHKHGYERFAPQDADGRPDPDGMREIVVATGGSPEFYDFGELLPTSEVHATDVHGILQLDLSPTSYRWQFVPAAGTDFTDEGTATCR